MSKKRTPAPRDKRSRLDLELFVLALIEGGACTPYQLMSEAGLSPGATLPVLGRLEEGGYVLRGSPGPRGRSEYAATAAGRQLIKKEWQRLLEATINGDVESILRTVMLALRAGAGRKEMSGFLKRAAEAKSAESQRRKADTALITPKAVEGNGAGFYKWMHAVHSSARLAIDARVLRDLAKRLGRTR